MALPSLSKVTILANHISQLFVKHQAAFRLNPSTTRSALSPPPLFIALQGPQGIGKTTLTTSLVNALESSSSTALADSPAEPRATKLVVLSLDDFYLPHKALSALATASQNKLFQGRGLPGTHDVPLLKTTLEALYHINEPPDGVSVSNTKISVNLPRYDKSAYGGQGDREAEPAIITGPVDIVLVEGWCMGFYPISDTDLQHKWDRLAASTQPTMLSDNTDAPEERLEREVIERLGITAPDVTQVNELLGDYANCVYPYFTGGFIQLAPPLSEPYSLIYRWRLEQEHSMKAKNGGRGMSDEQVKLFIDRYIPGYIFFGSGVINGRGSRRPPSQSEIIRASDYQNESIDSTPTKTPWEGKGLRLLLDEHRDIVDVQQF